MKKIATIAAAIVCLAAWPASAESRAGTASMQLAQADVSVRIGTPGVGVYVGERPRRHWRRHRAECRTVTIRERRGGKVIIRKVRHC